MEKNNNFTELAINITNLSQSFSKKTIFTNMNLAIPKGSFYGILGHNGAGKTTLIKTILGAFPHQKGSIHINGLDNTNPLSRQKIGYTPEKTVFLSKIYLFDYLKMWCILEQDKIEKEEIKDMIDFFKLKPFQSLNTLSTGMAKKVVLAQCFLSKHDIYILDEPTDGLDAVTRKIIIDLLVSLHKNGKTIIIIITHILNEFANYIDHFIILDHGQIIAQKEKKNTAIWDIQAEYEKYYALDKASVYQKIKEMSEE
ncbi:ABC transporter ATP-binding protein [Spiroplasma sp. SV19]|uniref:ATP-binding cassette domain-containing protein n=1 Tax=Spiroplasma sp. SV19 TaxID=2570468 RepID=UPI0024B74416|nr:ABC transporter ATP-binding protein [Spiroplasma sp. SV19]